MKYLIWKGIKNLDEAKKVIGEYYKITPGVYAIELNENKKCIGCLNLSLEIEHDKSGFGYVLNKNYWNKGYMTEALNRILVFCFEKLELNRVESSYYKANIGSGKVMQKCKMQFEGEGIEEVKIKGIFHDVIHYGITKKQWKNKIPK